MRKQRSFFFAFGFFAIALAATAGTLAAAAEPPGPTAPATAKVTFRGTEYLLRSSQGNTSDFTPADRRTFLLLPT